MRAIDVTSAFLGSAARLGAGLVVGPLGPRPAQRLVLYEFEACPFCRKVREGLSMLDLEVEIRPCPKGGTRFRPEVERLGGKAQFPYLVDPNVNAALYESDDILAHLYRHYGDGPVPLLLQRPVAGLTSPLASAVRPGRGRTARPSRAPDAPLELYSFEASPFCRLVREVLCELELPYVLHNVAKKSPSRAAFVARAGKMQVPWLFDPSTGVGLYESAEIVAYLERTWGQPAG